MDEEESFARLLSASTPVPQPSLYPTNSDADPWANPFESDYYSATAPVAPAATEPEPAHHDAYSQPGYDREQLSYRQEEYTAPDPPSVIAARETQTEQHRGFDDYSSDPYASAPFAPSSHHFKPSEPSQTSSSLTRVTQPPPTSDVSNSVHAPSTPPSRRLPDSLLDEDLLASHDPRATLTRAFVKTTSSPSRTAPASASTTEGAAVTHEKARSPYVFKPKEEPERPTPVPTGPSVPEKEFKTVPENDVSEPHIAPVIDVTVANELSPTAVPLPESEVATPASSRPLSPSPLIPPEEKREIPAEKPEAVDQPAVEPTRAPAQLEQAQHATLSPLPLTTPLDRVSVSPLDTPADADYGFRSLSIGGTSNGLAPLSEPTVSSTVSPSRFNGRGWGAIDEPTSDLFGSPARTGGDPWTDGGGGWGEPGPLSGPLSAPVRPITPSPPSSPSPGPSTLPMSPSTSTGGGQPGSPRRSKLLNTPVFQITVSDPTKVGDPVRGHVVYTVKTKTTSPHYRRGEFSVLRRFSDFLWLFEALSANNPGVIVPPVPDKHAFGRFQDQFIETRRAALQRCLGKMTAHPVLQLDPDLRLFLESDSFSFEIKNRRPAAEAAAASGGGGGLLASWTGPKYVEQDEWFDSRKVYLDQLENQLKTLAKSLDAASRARIDTATAMGDFADAIGGLAESDLGSAMCSALARLADIARREREAGEDQAKADVGQVLNLADEYIRFIASVRLAFASRIRTYHIWQGSEKDVVRLRQTREKARAQGKLGDRAASSLAEVGEAERRSRDASADFEAQSKLVKTEFARFERERVEEFKRTLERHLDGQIKRQKELVEAWEEYHAVLLKMVAKSQEK